MYARTLREMDYNSKKMWVVLARSENCPSIPEVNGVIRVDDYLQSCALTTDGKVGSKGWWIMFDYNLVIIKNNFFLRIQLNDVLHWCQIIK